MAGFGAVATAKYVALTTFRKDGTPVVTPLWAALDGDRLVMWTVTDSWKVKRIRRNPEVIVQACDARGKELTGEPVPARAEILDAVGTERVRGLIAAKYGIVGRISMFGSTLRRGKSGTIALTISVDEPA
ncbi:PPOX class F420-dependent oxidoreductase [Gordonia sp. (in: high G+C Gram-positive bacteria)]|uniref:PPOX class F420-dependent oxidoreductase n=1 Tax=Gordonia sp. (in: high G+C Gram-positive bacteria) TaxID=84139 RepID=UPI0019BFB9CB|nr:PPOX class F420-dependent oxidoreductase [Gordonia sp. (in: high G+C Gram-positive bacteria)]MBD0021529.1 PPOX class F420-dependent oxidoreductase [Gordonia sp. (in: high G+C Gram-positive bacteria)]